jgi:uncharacterized tellurite resistance protein B-like protein
MFLNLLTEEQKKTFMALATRVMMADDQTDPREERLFSAMRQEMGLWQEFRLPQGSLEDLAASFPDKKSRGVVMLELLGLVYADDRFATQEQKLLRGLANLFEISQETADNMEAWVLQHKELMNRALGFLQ